MKVLMVNHPGTLRFRGGDLTQMRETAAALRPLGVEAGESFDPEPDARGYDVAHVFNIRNFRATLGQVRAVKRAGVPVVMSPIYLNVSFPIYANRCVKAIFSHPRTGPELAGMLRRLRDRTLTLQTPGGGTLAAGPQNRSEPGCDYAQREILRAVDFLLPNSVLELDALVKTLGVCGLPFTVVPYAARPAVFAGADPEPFARDYGRRDFVLQVGRIEASKNQLLAVIGLRDLGLPVVLIGGSLQPDYLEWVKAHGPKDLTVIPHLEHDQLRSAYAAARVHMLPSWVETCGLTTMEAALAGCSVVCSTAGYELEYYRDFADYCDPTDPASVGAAVGRAWDRHAARGDRRAGLAELIRREYTWERAAELTLAAYRRVLAETA